MALAPDDRVRALNGKPVNEDGRYVLYWMVANRRTRYNFALEHAVAHARELDRPLLVLEALRCGYRWACDRFHRFILDGMRDNAGQLERAGVRHLAYVEPEAGAGRGLLAELSRHACRVVTDDYPAFMLPAMIEAGARDSAVRLEAVDSNGLMPLGAADRAYPTAHAFRRFLQKTLRPHLDRFPAERPLARLRLPKLARLPAGIASRWPAAGKRLLDGGADALAALPIDHAVEPVDEPGGSEAAGRILRRFLDRRLERYADGRNHPDEPVASGLSAHLHFGHVSAHEVCRRILDREDWTSDLLAPSASGSREGWWGLSPAAEAFLDELVTWREVGYNMCRHRDDYDRYESLPDWARKTLAQHAGDPREALYTLEQFEAAETHDEIWNAAQRELLRDGRIHNYLRMLWGKKILHWSASPQDALDVMIELNNKYAVDGRDPNSYSGIFWVLGRYDRAWGPEREVFGKVRYMTSDSTKRKLRLRGYLERYGA